VYKKCVVSGTLHYAWDDTMAIIFEFRRVRLRGKYCSGTVYFTVLNSLLTGVDTSHWIPFHIAVTTQHVSNNNARPPHSPDLAV
jgi:hypothetical protein